MFLKLNWQLLPITSSLCPSAARCRSLLDRLRVPASRWTLTHLRPVPVRLSRELTTRIGMATQEPFPLFLSLSLSTHCQYCRRVLIGFSSPLIWHVFMGDISVHKRKQTIKKMKIYNKSWKTETEKLCNNNCRGARAEPELTPKPLLYTLTQSYIEGDRLADGGEGDHALAAACWSLTGKGKWSGAWRVDRA